MNQHVGILESEKLLQILGMKIGGGGSSPKATHRGLHTNRLSQSTQAHTSTHPKMGISEVREEKKLLKL